MTTEPAILQTKAKIKSADIEGGRMTVEVILPYNNAWSQYSKSMSCLQSKVDKAAWVRLSALVDIDPETVVTLLYTEKPSDKGKGMYRDLVDVQVPGMAAPKDPNADAPLFPEEEPRKPAPRMSDQAFAAQAQKSYAPPISREDGMAWGQAGNAAAVILAAWVGKHGAVPTQAQEDMLMASYQSMQHAIFALRGGSANPAAPLGR